MDGQRGWLLGGSRVTLEQEPILAPACPSVWSRNIIPFPVTLASPTAQPRLPDLSEEQITEELVS